VAKRDVNIVFRADDKTKRGIANVTRSIGRVGKRLTKITAGFSAAGIAASAAIVQSQVPVIDALGKTADRLGLTTEALGGLRHAADLAGVSSSTLDMSLQRFNRRVSEAAGGSGEAVDALHELGLNAKELEKMPLDQSMQRVADAFGNVAGQGDKTRLAMKLFDSEGVSLLNMLEGQGEGLREAALEADNLGLALSRVEVAQVEAANDSMTKFKGVLKGVGTQFTVALAPAIETAANWMAQLTLDSGAFGNLSVKLQKIFITVFGGLLDKIRDVKIGILLVRIGMQQWVVDMANLVAPAMSKMTDGFNSVSKWIKGPDGVVGSYGQIENNWIVNFATEGQKAIDVLATELHDLQTAVDPSQALANSLDTIVRGSADRARVATGEATNIVDEANEEEEQGAKQKFTKLTEYNERYLKDKNKFEALNRQEQAAEITSHLSGLFAKNKAFAVANAIMNTYDGANAALARYAPPLGFVMAAAVIASGLQQVAQIRKQSFLGGGFTGSGPRSGGVDGMGGFPAILHPNESVIDHTRGGAGTTVINNIDAKGADAGSELRIRQAIQESSEVTIARIINLQRRGRLA